MNAVKIEEAVSRLAEAPFDPEEFPFAFLEAFGNKAATLKRLKSNSSNQSDLGGVLQRNNVHRPYVRPDRMYSEFLFVREAHDRNDKILERIYIGRCFKNDTERLERNLRAIHQNDQPANIVQEIY
jgi:hypothetical protein